MATKLTEALARKIEAPTDGKGYIIVYDEAVRGFGLRVTKSNSRSWILTYRNRQAREHRVTIGRFEDWPLPAARGEARRLKRIVDADGDPLEQRQEERDAPTVNDLADRYITDHLPRLRESSQRDAKGMLNKWIRPELGKLKVAVVKHADVDRLHRKMTVLKKRHQANRAVALLSKMFNLAIKWEMRTDNPAKGVERNEEAPRQRYLSGDELVRLMSALTKHSKKPSADAVRLLLLTGGRRSEVLSATWDQFDLTEGVWTKPSAHTKQKKEHRVPLSAPARQLLNEMCQREKAAAKKDEREPNDQIFPGRGTKNVAQVQLKHFWRTVCKEAKLADLRVHDLRHSYASTLAGAGLSLPIIGMLLGHTQAATTQRYAHLADAPLRAATERVGDAVVAAAGGKTADNVVAMPEGAHK